MKKLLVSGGVLFSILPAMATGLDLSDYHLIDSNTANPTCVGPEGYTGFTDGDVTMAPLYIEQCGAGYYLNADNASVTEHKTNNELDYYVVNACQAVTSGEYSAGVTTPTITSGVLMTSGLGTCPQTYPESDGHGRTNGVPESQNDCYKVCSNSNITSQTLSTLHALSANYIGGDANGGKAYYGYDCTIHIGSCVDGYESLDLAQGSTLEKCAVGAVSCSASAVIDQYTLTASEVMLSKGRRLYKGTFSCSDVGVCSATISQVRVKKADNSGWFNPMNLANSISVEGDDYTTQGACEAACGTEAGWDTLIATAIADTANGGLLTDGTTFCAAKVVDIDWVGDDAGTCIYDGSLTLPAEPEKAGHSFIGWTVGEVTNE